MSSRAGWLKLAVASTALVWSWSAAAAADYGTADSPEFPVDLLTLPSVGTVAAADSPDFSLDLRLVNRDWADSGSFSFSDAPPPAPYPSSVECPNTAVPNEPFDVRVLLGNNGGPGDHGGISLSFPELIDTNGLMPPYLSTNADVAVHADTTFGVVGFYDRGDTIYAEGVPTTAQHLLVEGDESAWDYGETQTLTLTITPKVAGPLTIRIRAWIAAPGTSYGPPVYRWPDQGGSDRELDQQQYWAQVVLVTVLPAALQPGTLASIHATDLHAIGIAANGVKMGIAEADDDYGNNLPWSGHAALSRLQNGVPVAADASNHATQVASVMVGSDSAATPPLLGTTLPALYEFRGVAPSATLFAGQTNYWWTIDDAVTVLRDQGCSAVNVSAGIDPDNVFAIDVNQAIDDIVDNDKVVVVAATGNLSMPSDDEVASPAEAYNVIAVGALGASDNGGTEQDGPWNTSSAENIPGPTSGAYYPAGRCKPDLVAPGDCVVARSAGGDVHGYTADGPGSSLAAPHVAGAAALLIEAARAAGAYFVEPGGFVDPRVIKSALLTGADKSVVTKPGVRPDPTWHTDGPIQPLDHHLGAGGLDVLEAKKVMLGEDDGGAIRHLAFDTITWSEQSLALQIGHIDAGSTLVASLVWNAHVYGIVADISDLDLYLLKGGVEVAWSRSAIDNVEHIYLTNLADGDYALRVDYAGHVLTDTEELALSYRIESHPIVMGDFDHDGDIDLVDFAYCADCLAGPQVTPAPTPPITAAECQNAFDFDADGDVDLADFAVLEVNFSVP